MRTHILQEEHVFETYVGSCWTGGKNGFGGIRRRSTGPAVPGANQKANGKRRTGLTLRYPKGEIFGFSPEQLKSHQRTCSLQTKEETRTVHCWTC